MRLPSRTIARSPQQEEDVNAAPAHLGGEQFGSASSRISETWKLFWLTPVQKITSLAFSATPVIFEISNVRPLIIPPQLEGRRTVLAPYQIKLL